MVKWHADADQKQRSACWKRGAASIVIPVTIGDSSSCGCRHLVQSLRQVPDQRH